jgi:hypothetical protein
MRHGVVFDGQTRPETEFGGVDGDPIRTLLAQQIQKLRPGTSAEAAWAGAGVVTSALEDHSFVGSSFDASTFDIVEVAGNIAQELQRTEGTTSSSGSVATT